MDHDVAHKLGLKKFVQGGSSGVERIGMGWKMEQSAGAGAGAGGASGGASGAGLHKERVATVMNENDVLLMGNENDRGGNGGRHLDAEGDLIRRDTVCYKLMAWVFEW